MKIKNAKEMDVSNVILCATVYGKAGTGKTTLGATFPKPLFLDMNKGLLSIRGMDVDYIELYQANFMEIKDYIEKTEFQFPWVEYLLPGLTKKINIALINPYLKL